MRTGTCKFFNGMQNKTCDAGVRYRDVTPEPDRLEGSGLRLPCFSKPWVKSSADQLEEFAKRGTCEKYTEPTTEEIAAEDAAMEAAMKRMMSASELIGRIKKEHAGKSWQGIEVCPACGGKLHIGIVSINGHTRGRCETKDCLNWIE